MLIELPPLRARPGDIEVLCDEVLDDSSSHHGRRVLSTASRRMLRDYRWPGNVRELRQTLTRGAALSNLVIDPHHLFQAPLRRPTPAEIPVSGRCHDGPARFADGTEPPPLPRLDLLQRDLIVDALARHGSLRAAAEAVGIPKSTFADRAHKLGLLGAPAQGTGGGPGQATAPGRRK